MQRLFLIGLLISLISCTSDTLEPDPQKVGFSYFPLQVGDFRIYQIHKEHFSIFAESDTTDYQLKELVADSFATQNEITFVLHRLSREQEQDPWQLDSVWTARRTANHAIVVENNIPFAKLVFPVAVNKTWDGNVFNTRLPDNYEITAVNTSFETPAGPFGNTLTVFENNDPDSLIFQDIRQVVYALDVGLIYKFSSILDFCNTSPECLGNLETGTVFEQLLIEYGEE